MLYGMAIAVTSDPLAVSWLVIPLRSTTARAGSSVANRFDGGGVADHMLARPAHLTGSLLLAQGIDPRPIMEILGHARIAVTASIYTHVSPALKQQAARAMDAALAPPPAAQPRMVVRMVATGGAAAPMPNGPGRIRTCNLGIMSSLLCP